VGTTFGGDLIFILVINYYMLENDIIPDDLKRKIQPMEAIG
jgi:hypothetical protein